MNGGYSLFTIVHRLTDVVYIAEAAIAQAFFCGEGISFFGGLGGNMKDGTDHVTKWLLEPENPAVRYRTLVSLLDRKETDSDVIEAKTQIIKMPVIQEYLHLRNPGKLWDCPPAGKKDPIPDPLHMRNWSRTLLALTVLAEHGLTRENREVNESVKAFLSLLRCEDDFKQPCRNSLLLRQLYLLGYGKHKTTQRLLSYVNSTIRWDGGRLCSSKEGKRKSRPAKSCIRAAVKTLLASADVPEMRECQNARRVADYFLKRNLLFRTDSPGQLVRHELGATIFPFSSGAPGLLETIYGMCSLGFGKRRELEKAWQVLESKKDHNGLYALDMSPRGYSNCPLPQIEEGGGKPSKWITFYVMLAKMHAYG